MQKMTPAQQREQVALMEQSLLADRFNLKAHFETREMPVYALVVAKRGPKLNAAKSDEASRISTVGNVAGGEMTAVGDDSGTVCALTSPDGSGGRTGGGSDRPEGRI